MIQYFIVKFKPPFLFPFFFLSLKSTPTGKSPTLQLIGFVMTLYMLRACVAYPTYVEVTFSPRRPVEKPTDMLETSVVRQVALC